MKLIINGINKNLEDYKKPKPKKQKYFDSEYMHLGQISGTATVDQTIAYLERAKHFKQLITKYGIKAKQRKFVYDTSLSRNTKTIKNLEANEEGVSSCASEEEIIF